LIRDAIRLTASLATTPDNTYGYGIVNANSAVGYGVSMAADVRVGNGPLTVQFTGASFLSPTSWAWDFGDGGTSDLQNPVHQYQTGGSYNVSLTVETALYGPLTDSRPGYILVTGDSLFIETDSAYAGQQVAISFNLTNSQSLDQIIIPFEIAKTPFTTTVDSITRGSRTTTNWNLSILGVGDHRYCYSLESSTSPLPAGSGEVLRLYLKTDKFALGSLSVPVDTAIVSTIVPTLHAAAAITYYPTSFAGAARTRYVRRGNADNSPDFNIDIGDLTALIIDLFLFGPPPVTIQSGDAEPNLNLDIGDITWLVGYLFLEGPPPIQP
jgi:PKD repeat protein